MKKKNKKKRNELNKKKRNELYKKVIPFLSERIIFLKDKTLEQSAFGICNGLSFYVKTLLPSEIQYHFPEVKMFAPYNNASYFWSLDETGHNERALGLCLMIEMTK